MNQLELGHVFWMVDPHGDWPARFAAAGIRLDDGIAHPGQGTRNRRMWMPDSYLELAWVDAPADAATNPLRFDRRTCPLGIGLAGALPDKTGWWPYQPPYAPGFTIWIHDGPPDGPLVFASEATPEVMARYAPANRLASTPELLNPYAIRELRVRMPGEMPPVLAPFVTWTRGPARLDVVLGIDLAVTDTLALVA